MTRRLADDRLLRPQFGMHRLEWPDESSVEFHLPHGEMIKLLRDVGLEVEALVEMQAPAGAPPHRFGGLPAGVGAQVAERRDLEGAQARLIPEKARPPAPPQVAQKRGWCGSPCRTWSSHGPAPPSACGHYASLK